MVNKKTLSPIEMQKNAVEAASFLKLLSNPSRLLVLCQLVDGERSVGELETYLDISQSALSQHLARLRAEGLVSTRKDGQTVNYAIKDAKVLKVLELIYAMYCRK